MTAIASHIPLTYQTYRTIYVDAVPKPLLYDDTDLRQRLIALESANTATKQKFDTLGVMLDEAFGLLGGIVKGLEGKIEQRWVWLELGFYGSYSANHAQASDFYGLKAIGKWCLGDKFLLRTFAEVAGYAEGQGSLGAGIGVERQFGDSEFSWVADVDYHAEQNRGYLTEEAQAYKTLSVPVGVVWSPFGRLNITPTIAPAWRIGLRKSISEYKASGPTVLLGVSAGWIF
jgi:hypothetical protein